MIVNWANFRHQFKNAKLMKKLLPFLIIMFAVSLAHGQYSIVLLDSMDTGGQFIDNALRMDPPPEGFDQPQASYIVKDVEDSQGLSFPAVMLDSLPLAAGVTGLFRSWASYDYTFPRNVDRTPGDTLKIEFDLMFSAAGGSGESGRLNISLLTDLPEDGITPENFGKPAYHIWIFNGSYGPALSYGGEFVENPGWNSGAGGYYYNENAGDPNTAVLYPNTDNYPLVPYAKENQSGAAYFSTTTWKHYTWVIAKDMMHLYWRNTADGPEKDEEILFMAIPQNSSLDFINETHGTFASELPPAYEWFDVVNGFRVFSRGASNHTGYMSNLKITKTGAPVSTYAEFQQVSAARRRVRADAESFTLPVMLYNAIDGDPTSVTVKLAKGNPGHVNGFSEETIEFPDNTGGELVSQGLALTLTDMYMTENDTLLFELADISGGYFPAFGTNNRFELVVRPSGATPPTSIQEYRLKNLMVYPNPATSLVRVSNLNQFQLVSVELMDITGKLLMTENNFTSGQIDISHLETGLYFLRFSDENETVTKRLIKK
jgi:hypothetical protein